MSLFTTNYSAIITKGMGGPATCQLLLAKFSLTGFCHVEVVRETQGGGGGWSPTGGFYVPFPKALNQQTRMVLIAVKFSKEQSWRRSYVIKQSAAGILIKVINFTNSAKDKLNVGVDKIHQIGKKVSAIFKKI